MAIGGLNWLVFGLSGYDVGSLFGGMDMIISKVIYVLVGVATVYDLATHRKTCKECAGGQSM